ncbi:hypothetical protein [Pannonibacter phragmitetus]|uniref:hypothetical protein n=1 Tax=Pannonibacter phragmitetus TaxID=121719 RepID=UPI000B96E9B8|nr:hypothetical protein [Pannonibacter phragmitetus]
MPYAVRSTDGALTALYAAPQAVGEKEDGEPIYAEHEWLADDAAEVVAFLAPAPSLPALTARQFRLGLLDSGMAPAQVDAVIAQIADETERARAQIEWEYASQFQRSHPLVATLSAALGLTPEQVDVMWADAAQL